MKENLKKATELLAKYGFAFDAEKASDERADIAMMSACYTFLSVSTDMPASERMVAADILNIVAQQFYEYYSALSEKAYSLANMLEELGSDIADREYQQEKAKEGLDEMFDFMNIKS